MSDLPNGSQSPLKAVSDGEDDLDKIAALQRTLHVPVITSVSQMIAWLALPATDRTPTADIEMALFSFRRFEKGYFLNFVDRKRAFNFSKTKRSLESLHFSLRKNYIISISLYLVPFGSKNSTASSSLPPFQFLEGSVVRCNHVTGLHIKDGLGIPKGNVSGLHRISLVSSPVPTDSTSTATQRSTPTHPGSLVAALGAVGQLPPSGKSEERPVSSIDVVGSGQPPLKKPRGSKASSTKSVAIGQVETPRDTNK